MVFQAEMQLTFHSELTGGRESSETISSHLHVFYLNFKLVMKKKKSTTKQKPPFMSNTLKCQDL